MSDVGAPCVYAGIGSRSTPLPILQLMVELASGLARAGFTLRSGGSAGADYAFESGCDALEGEKEIFLPWKGFNGNRSKLCFPAQEAFEIAREIHPRWSYCRQAARKLHARNAHQVLGSDLKTPASFIICWAPEKNGDVMGGTATAVNIAKRECIPVFNLWHRDTHELWRNVISDVPTP